MSAWPPAAPPSRAASASILSGRAGWTGSASSVGRHARDACVERSGLLARLLGLVRARPGSRSASWASWLASALLSEPLASCSLLHDALDAQADLISPPSIGLQLADPSVEQLQLVGPSRPGCSSAERGCRPDGRCGRSPRCGSPAARSGRRALRRPPVPMPRPMSRTSPTRSRPRRAPRSCCVDASGLFRPSLEPGGESLELRGEVCRGCGLGRVGRSSGLALTLLDIVQASEQCSDLGGLALGEVQA